MMCKFCGEVVKLHSRMIEIRIWLFMWAVSNSLNSESVKR